MKKVMGRFLVMAFLLTACNLQGSQPVDQMEISTAAALTVQAALDSSAAPLATPTLRASSSTSVPADSAAQTAQPTPTVLQPMVSVGDDPVNCRTGPGINYSRITSIEKGEPVKIVGFFPPNFWVVSTDLGECWVSGKYATPSGSLESIPTVSLPPTPEGGAPNAPTFPQGGWKYFCAAGNLEVTLNWKDNADNETGYRVYRDNTLVVEFPADTTIFYENVPVSAGQVVTYVVTVHNELGEASSNAIALSCE